MEASGASVAVFSEDAKDMFPNPADAIDEDEEEKVSCKTQGNIFK